MPLSVVLLAFGSAISHALWNVMLKRTKDLDSASAGVFAVALVVSGIASLFLPGRAFPEGAALSWGLAAGLFEGCYFVGLVRSLERAPLGWGYSWMRGSSIVLVWLPVSGDLQALCAGPSSASRWQWGCQYRPGRAFASGAGPPSASRRSAQAW